jgi:hypothetical protein
VSPLAPSATLFHSAKLGDEYTDKSNNIDDSNKVCFIIT